MTLEDVIEYPEVEYLEDVVSDCCGARITETGFCSECKENI